VHNDPLTAASTLPVNAGETQEMGQQGLRLALGYLGDSARDATFIFTSFSFTLSKSK
jgi:hypothetical protein